MTGSSAREGLTEWVEPTVAALNRRWPEGPPIDASEARAFYEDVKTWPRLKRLQAAERWWRTTVRRRDYDFFIFSTFDEV